MHSQSMKPRKNKHKPLAEKKSGLSFCLVKWRWRAADDHGGPCISSQTLLQDTSQFAVSIGSKCLKWNEFSGITHLKTLTVELKYNGLAYNIYSVKMYYNVQSHLMHHSNGWNVYNVTWILRTKFYKPIKYVITKVTNRKERAN